MIVVDASIAVKWFVVEQDHVSALQLLDQEHVLIAPDLIFSETTNVLWKKVRKGEATTEQCERAVGSLSDFFQGVISSAGVISNAFKLATRLDHSVYDCVYLACAQGSGAKLATADKRFISRIRASGLGHLVTGLDEIAKLDLASEDLSISKSELDRVLEISDQFNRTLSFVQERVGRPFGTGKLKLVNTADLTPAFDSPSRRQLRQALHELTTGSLCDLVALAWLGRGYDGHDWAALRKDAEGLLSNAPKEHEGYIISLLGYVQSGIDLLTAAHKHER